MTTPLPSRWSLALLALLAAVLPAQASFPILTGDPVDFVDPATGQPYVVLPGLPLIFAPQRGERPIIIPRVVGDVDLVVRAGQLAVGPVIPPPSTTPPVAVGGSVPFTVIVSDGAPTPALGNPLPGPEMDGLPVVVFAFADLDGDGIIGPTNADPDGAADNGRELQEALFPVGRQVALFTNGVAQGAVTIAKGAPASNGGLRIVLTAAAYVGNFDLNPDPRLAFMFGNVPQGPAVSTLLPLIPRTDPRRIVDGGGKGGRADSDVRISISLEADVDPLVGHPDVGTPFAIPTDGSSLTVDRAAVPAGPFERARFVQPTTLGATGVPTPVALYPGGDGTVFETLGSLTLLDDGAPTSATARLVPVDRLGNVTDPPAGTTITLLASLGVAIATPDSDGDPSREIVSLDTAAGVVVELDDDGGANDSGPGGTVTVVSGGFPTETLDIHFTPVGGSTTTTTSLPIPTTSTSSTSTTSTVSSSSSSSSSTSSSSSSSSSTSSSTTTSSSAPPSTTSTTTSTTTTTVPTPPGCVITADLDSVGCRLAALSGALRANVPPKGLRDVLVGRIDRAKALSAHIADLAKRGRRHFAQRLLMQLRDTLAAFRARLRSPAARRLIGTELRTELLAHARLLDRDVKALRLP